MTQTKQFKNYDLHTIANDESKIAKDMIITSAGNNDKFPKQSEIIDDYRWSDMFFMSDLVITRDRIKLNRTIKLCDS